MNLQTKTGLTFLKVFTIGTLLTGIYLHLSRLVFGVDNFQHFLFTPMFEMFFVMLMLIASILQVTFIKKVTLKTLLEKIIYYFTTFQFVASIPLHTRAFMVGSTDYVRVFPEAYSIFTIVMWCYFIYVFATLKIKHEH